MEDSLRTIMGIYIPTIIASKTIKKLENERLISMKVKCKNKCLESFAVVNKLTDANLSLSFSFAISVLFNFCEL